MLHHCQPCCALLFCAPQFASLLCSFVACSLTAFDKTLSLHTATVVVTAKMLLHMLRGVCVVELWLPTINSRERCSFPLWFLCGKCSTVQLSACTASETVTVCTQAQQWLHISLSLHCQVWDKRTVGSNSRPAGMFVGHTDGMTHLDPKGDGRYLISNCKDQTIKLWDMRNMMEPRQYNPKLIREQELAFRWYARLPILHSGQSDSPLATIHYPPPPPPAASPRFVCTS